MTKMIQIAIAVATGSTSTIEARAGGRGSPVDGAVSDKLLSGTGELPPLSICVSAHEHISNRSI
jgi:hypothetical protein